VSVYIIGVLGVGAVALLVLTLSQRRAAETTRLAAQHADAARAPVQVVVAPARMSREPELLAVTGDVQPVRKVSLYTRVEGYLESIRVGKGDRVVAGEVVAVVAAPDRREQRRSLATDRQVKRRMAERSQQLREQNLISKQELERSQGDYEMAEAALDGLEAMRRYEMLRAPFGGTVVARSADRGALVTVPSSEAAPPIVEIWDIDRVRIELAVSSADAPLVHVGTRVRIVRDERTPPEVAAVTRMTGVLDSHTRTMSAEIVVDNRDRRWLPGSIVNVRIELPSRLGLVIPVDAVTVHDGKPVAAVVRDGRASFRDVTLGRTDGRAIRVLEGVRCGELVALFPTDDLVEVARLRPVFADDGAAVAPTGCPVTANDARRKDPKR
jgi:RND family efflux transporter MFP subunit